MMAPLALAASLALAAAPPLKDWDRYEKSVRDQLLPKDSLRALFPPLYRALRGPPPPTAEGPGLARDSVAPSGCIRHTAVRTEYDLFA